VGVRQLVIDAWSWLNYKPVMADPHRPGHRAFPELASGWVPDDDMRPLGVLITSVVDTRVLINGEDLRCSGAV
jgi:hypothetical protein